MIPKVERQEKVEAQEKQLQLIYKYNPSLRFIKESVLVLQSLGLSDHQIMEVVSKGHTTLTNTIINPTTGDEMAIFVEDISVKKDKISDQYGVYIGSVPYREFFDKALITKSRLEELTKQNPEVRDIYQENQKLKALLAGLRK